MANDPSKGEERGLDQGADVSDLIGVKLTLGVALWFLVVLGCFFFIGPVVGIIAIVGRDRHRGDPGGSGDPQGGYDRLRRSVADVGLDASPARTAVTGPFCLQGLDRVRDILHQPVDQ